jgi:uncharacterized protein YjbJ (UPF0337 family)
MGGKTDQVKGQGKEEIGDLTGNKDPEFEGKVDRRSGEVKEKLDHAMDEVDGMIDKDKDLLHRK